MKLFDNQKKSATESRQPADSCECKSMQGLFIRNRQVSLVLAGILLSGFFIFMGGYFLGQKKALDRFANKVDQESFADTIYTSMCAMHGKVDANANGEAEAQNEDEEGAASEESAQHQPIVVAKDTPQVTVNQAIDTVAATTEEENDQKEGTEQGATVSEEHYAQLIGFGTATAAQQFADKLCQKGVPVFVKKKQSRSGRGRVVSWYQVITEKFQDKARLLALVQRLKQEEKLKDVRIITV